MDCFECELVTEYERRLDVTKLDEANQSPPKFENNQTIAGSLHNAIDLGLLFAVLPCWLSYL